MKLKAPQGVGDPFVARAPRIHAALRITDFRAVVHRRLCLAGGPGPGDDELQES